VWNSFDTAGPLGISAEIIPFVGGNGDEINAYVASPVGTQSRGGVVVAHHLPGWDEFTFEFVERLARHGYDVICPNLYFRYGHGTPAEVAARVKAQDGMVPDGSVVGDLKSALDWVHARPTNNGKVGVIGTCSGGRHAVLTASLVPGFDAVVDMCGGGVVTPADKATPSRPVAPVEYTEQLSAPLLGLFGNEDANPTAADVDVHEAELKKYGKDYEFHRYDDAGHAFIYYQTPMYRPVQAMDAWAKTFEFFDKTLST
jgi:carboxymethylenebutenolidase